jgi:hypothetical protein
MKYWAQGIVLNPQYGLARKTRYSRHLTLRAFGLVTKSDTPTAYTHKNSPSVRWTATTMRVYALCAGLTTNPEPHTATATIYDQCDKQSRTNCVIPCQNVVRELLTGATKAHVNTSVKSRCVRKVRGNFLRKFQGVTIPTAIVNKWETEGHSWTKRKKWRAGSSTQINSMLGPNILFENPSDALQRRAGFQKSQYELSQNWIVAMQGMHTEQRRVFPA